MYICKENLIFFFNLCSLVYYCDTFLLAKIDLLMHLWVFRSNDLSLIVNRTVGATGLIRFAGTSILFRFFTGMNSGGLLYFFTNFTLLLSKNTGKFLIMIKGKSNVKFELDWNHMISTPHLKRSLKQKRNITDTFLNGVRQFSNHPQCFVIK